jgi:hypothetical protein
MKKILPILLLAGFLSAQAQDSPAVVPGTTEERLHALEDKSTKQDRILNILREFRIQAYIQPEWQKAVDTAGIQSFAGGNFPTSANNRFLLRRGRFKLSWQHEIVNKKGDTIKVGEFAFQYDASEKGFTALKDFYGKIIDPWTGWFGLQAGIFLRPFGYESPAPPATYESPEFSRMNQTIMPNECELGEAIVIESPRTFKPLWLRVDASLVNGEGIGVGSQTGTYQSRKDFIGRLALGKIWKINDGLKIGLNGSGSIYYGGVMQTTYGVYEVQNINGVPQFKNIITNKADSAGRFSAEYIREYFGAHLQLNLDYKIHGDFSATTALRGEFIAGQQPGQLGSSQVPLGATNAVPGVDLYIRKFQGLMLFFTEGFHYKAGTQIMHSDITVKYDFYNPNTQASGSQILAADKFTTTDLTYKTLGIGYTWTPVPYFKLMLWYDHVMLANSGLTNLPSTVTKTDVFTLRTQFMIDTWWFDKKSVNNPNMITRTY